MRYAYIPRALPDSVAPYLPDNYQPIATRDGGTVIAGEDKAGWTLDAYVLPRLASGLMFGEEIPHAGAMPVCGCDACKERGELVPDAPCGGTANHPPGTSCDECDPRWDAANRH